MIVDIGAASARRHAIPAWFDVDVTDVLARLEQSRPCSLSVFVTATLARSVARHPHVHAVRDLRGRLVMFDDVDVNLSVEALVDGRPFPMNHVLRAAHARSVHDLDAEVRSVKSHPETSDTVRLAGGVRLYLALPGAVRSRLLGGVHRLPDQQKALMGTVGVSSVGMFGRGGGLGLPFLVHSLDVLVGGLQAQPHLDRDGRLSTRQMLSLAVVADHDVVDGAPLARFLADFRDDLNAGRALD